MCSFRSRLSSLVNLWRRPWRIHGGAWVESISQSKKFKPRERTHGKTRGLQVPALHARLKQVDSHDGPPVQQHPSSAMWSLRLACFHSARDAGECRTAKQHVHCLPHLLPPAKVKVGGMALSALNISTVSFHMWAVCGLHKMKRSVGQWSSMRTHHLANTHPKQTVFFVVTCLQPMAVPCGFFCYN